MTDFPGLSATPLIIPSHSKYFSLAAAKVAIGTTYTIGAATWPAANTAIFHPFYLPFRYIVRRMFWVNGTTASGNWDIGIYSSAGKRLVSSGSTAASGTSVPQFVTLANPLLIGPGFYYLATALSITTASRAFGSSTLSLAKLRQAAGVLYQATALPLPDPMVGVAPTGSALWQLCGITRTTSGF